MTVEQLRNLLSDFDSDAAVMILHAPLLVVKGARQEQYDPEEVGYGNTTPTVWLQVEEF